MAYNGALQGGASVKQENAITASICRSNNTPFKITKPIAFIDIAKCAAKASQMGSKENVTNITFVMIVLCRAWHLRYSAAMTEVQEAYYEIDTCSILIRTIDGFYGNESPVPILNLTITDEVGFLRDGGHLMLRFRERNMQCTS